MTTAIAPEHRPHPHTAPRGENRMNAVSVAANAAGGLWDSVVADTTRAEWERQHGVFPTAALDAYDAEVFHKKRRCRMTFDRGADKLRVVRLANRPGGKEHIILNAPMRCVLNMETPEEREQRQRMHAANDDIEKCGLNGGVYGYRNSQHYASRYMCSFAESSTESNVYFHSRVTTMASTASGGLNHSVSATSYLGVSVVPVPFPAAAFGTTEPVLPCKYFVHYCRLQKTSSGKCSVHTIELNVSPDPAAATEAFTLAKAVLRRVYLSGPKTLITFISPKSGTGQGEEVFKSQVRPYLHFSRHKLHVIVTTRAHDAEDYVADTDHYMDDSCAIVAVGGDGMVHEVVNGLYRRRLKLAAVIQRECQRRTCASESANTPATATAFNFAIGAKAVLIDSSSTISGIDVATPGILPDAAAPTAVTAAVREANEEGEDYRDAAEDAILSSPATQELKRKRTERALDAEGSSTSTSDDNSASAGASAAPTTPRGTAAADARQCTADALTKVSAAQNGNERAAAVAANASSAALHVPAHSAAAPLLAADPSYAARVTDIFLARGWDGLLPMVATVPSGSACGLAKSLDVLSTMQAAVALVHGAWVPEDLLSMRFTPNADLLAFHRERWSDKMRRRAEAKFSAYQLKTRAEREQREASLEAGAHALPPTTQPARGQQEQHRQDEQHQREQEERAQQQTEKEALNSNSGNSNELTSRASGSYTPSATVSTRNGSFAGLPPFLHDGTAVYQDPVSMFVGAPEMSHRVAFMSLSFGVANDIDHGSEHLRWMGNARFAVYGAYVILKGVTTYRGTIRYLPWESVDGLKLEKLHRNDKIPDPSQLPRCTMRGDCPHCLAHMAPQPLVEASRVTRRRAGSGRGDGSTHANGVQTERDGVSIEVARAENRAERVYALQSSVHEYCAPQELDLDPATVANASEADLMGEDDINFDDESLPWVTIRGDIYNLLVCNLRDVAQDMMMAPLSHMSDGAMDLVFSRVDYESGKGGRKEFIQFFSGLEKGDHVNRWFTNYVKARAVEVKIDGGISMSDGEMMPLSSVRLTKMRSGGRFIRLDN